ncbi:MAG: YdbH domain-containing protein [Rhodospirillaceae bacterium]|nr:YdbH domain-containing protein [Rhodospirillaceae bacterium]
MMRYPPSRYMQRRRRSLLGVLARVGLWIVVVLGVVLGLAWIFAAPVAGFFVSRALNERGLGPVTLNISRLDLSGLAVRDVSLLDRAVTLAALDVDYTWRGLAERRIDSAVIDGLNARVTWGPDGTVKLGALPLWPRPAPPEAGTETPDEPTAPPDEPPAVAVGRISVGNSRLVIALPGSEIATDLKAEITQVEGARTIAASLASSGAAVMNVSVDAEQPQDAPATGTASFDYNIQGLTLPGLAKDVSGDGALRVIFDPQGARSENARLELSFRPENVAGPVAQFIDAKEPVKLTLAGTNSRLFTFTLDRTKPMPAAALDLLASLENGRTQLQATVKGWSDAPLGGAIPQDFVFERIGVSARGLKLLGGAMDAELALADFKGPIAVAEGKVAASINGQDLAPGEGRSIGALTGAIKSGVRLDGLSLSFDLSEAFVEAADAALNPTTMAAGKSRVALSDQPGGPRQVNIVFGGDGSTTLTADVTLGAKVPSLKLGDPSGPADAIAVAALDLPAIMLGGYLSQREETSHGELTLKLRDGALAHPTVGLTALTADLGFDGARLAGPISARLKEPRNPARPRSLDRLGAVLNSNLSLDSQGVDLEGQFLVGSDTEIGTFSYAARPGAPWAADVKIPARDWSDQTTFMDAFGPVMALSRTSGTFGLEADLSPDVTAAGGETIGGTAKLVFGDFGFTADALTMQGLNGVIALDQIWPPRAAEPQRLAFARMVAGLPITEGDLTLALPGDGTAVISNAIMKLARGRIAGRDMVVPIDGRDGAFALDVANVDVGALVATFPTEGLSATGTLNGRIPFTVNNSGLFISEARLVGRDGNITYAPPTPPAALAQGGGTILLQALADFKYEEITARLNGNVTKDIGVSLQLKGRNPGLYGGYPIEFNLTLDGPLNRLVREGLSGYRIPDDIKQRLEQQGLGSAAEN